MDPWPCLRPEIDAVPTQHMGETLFVMHDRSGLSTAQLAVSPVVMYVAMQLDGQTSVLDLQDRFAQETGGTHLSSDQIEQIIRALDESMFLRGPKFDSFVERIETEFQEASVRAALGAGSAYDEDADALKANLDEMMQAAPGAEEPPFGTENGKPPRGVVAPHIDFARGGPGYGQVYRELARRTPPQTVIVLGTAHTPMRNRFSVLRKDFAVPGGVLRHDEAVTKELLEACRTTADFTEDAFVHRGEHSVELQAIWLRHVWPEVKIVPVLVGSMYDFLQGDDPDRAADDVQIVTFVKALQDLIKRHPDVMLLASADLSHIGPRFGDAREIGEAFLQETEEADRAYLRALSFNSGEGLRCLASHKDQYHVCGTGCLFVLGQTLAGVPGRLLGYHQAATPEMQQAVSFAGMLFE